MAKFKSYNYDQTIMVPVNLQDQLVPGSLEFADLKNHSFSLLPRTFRCRHRTRNAI